MCVDIVSFDLFHLENFQQLLNELCILFLKPDSVI